MSGTTVNVWLGYPYALGWSPVSPAPNLADFLTFIRVDAGIDNLVLPDAAPSIGYALNMAMAVCNRDLVYVATPPTGPWTYYALAVYNLGVDNLINFAPDQPGRTWFRDVRRDFNIQVFAPGVTLTSSDGGTSQTRLNPEFMKTFTMRDLRNLKTPWGRQYLEMAMDFGTLWGIA